LEAELVTFNTMVSMFVTGNGVLLAQDTVRRFIPSELDARMEDSERQSFPGDIEADVTRSRATILAALLTIWRWGRLASTRHHRLHRTACASIDERVLSMIAAENAVALAVARRSGGWRRCRCAVHRSDGPTLLRREAGFERQALPCSLSSRELRASPPHEQRRRTDPRLKEKKIGCGRLQPAAPVHPAPWPN
jgi:hypothetical protein